MVCEKLAMGEEAAIENQVCWVAKRHGYLPRKVQWIARRGAPDRVFFGHGRCVLIEFKRPGEVLKGQQLQEFKRLAAAYHDVHWADSVTGALAILGIKQ